MTAFRETSVYTGGTDQNPTKEVIGSTLYFEEKDSVTGWTTRKAVRNPNTGGEGFILSAHTYDERGRLRVSVGPDGVSTVTTYNELDQLHSERRSGLTTTYQYDVLGRVEETAITGSRSNESLTTFTTYWPSGDTATYKDEDGLETSFFSQLTNGNRVETTERPDNMTEVKTYHRDGQLKSITGTGVVHRFYRYDLSDGASQIGSETIASGHITTTEIIGVEPTGTNLASHRYSQTTVNGDGRAYLQSRPSFDGGVSIRKSFYNQNGALWKQTEPDLAPMLYVYNEFDQIERQGRDVNHDDFLSESTSASDKVPDDSISATSNDYYTDGANWFRRNASRQWLEDGNANSTEVSVSLTQLTGLPANTVSRSVYTDIYSQDTVVTTTVSGTTVTTTTDLPQSTMDKVTTTVNGRRLSSTSATGSGRTFFHYDAMGRLDRVVGAMGGLQTTRYEYYPNSRRLKKVIPPAGPASGYFYKGAGELGAGQIASEQTLDRISGAVLKEISYIYDSRGNKVSERGGTYPKDFVFDPNYPEMTKLRTYRDISLNPDQYDETEWRYHQATGLLERKEYANDHGTDYAWYDSGRLKSRIWARGNGGVVTNYAYDALGNPDTVTYTDGTPPVDFDYNRSGRMVAVSDVAGDHALSYQPDGKMNTETISGSGLLSGFTLSNELGVSGQALRESFGISGNSTTAVTNSFGYLNGRMSTASQGSTTATYQLQANSDWVQSVALEKGNDIATHWSHRDPAGRITGQIARRGNQPTGAILASAGYKYDSHGRREWLTREDGTRWEFGYNDRDEVQSGKKRLPNNGAYLAGQQFSYNYDDIGNRTTAQFGGQENGGGLRTISYTLDADHDPAAVGSVNQYRKIDYSGHVSLIGYGGATTQVLPSTPALLTETDQANQSNRWWRELQLQSPAESSGLFADLSFEENGVPLADAQGELWLNPTNYEPEYDLDGNLTSDARWDYTWNGENRLIRMTTKASAQATGHPWVRLTFAYDWQGRRVQKKVEEGTTGNVTKDLRYLYDGWNLIAEYKVDVQSSQLTLQNSYLWGFDLSGTQQGAGGVGGLLAVTQHEASNELCYFPSYDGNGNIIAWINESGVVAQRNDYDPFGNLIAKQGDIEGLNYGFSTKYTDEETGLCYYGYRYYDPVTGRWPSRDPIEERGGVNLYGFVGNNGLSNYDKLGLYILSSENEQYRKAVKAALEDITKGKLCWRKTKSSGWALVAVEEGKNKKLWNDLKKGIDLKRPIRIISIAETNNAWGIRYSLGGGQVKINLAVNFRIPVDPVITEATDNTPPIYTWDFVDFSALLWHELVGHVILKLDHPKERWNYWNEGYKEKAERHPEWGGKSDPVILIENEARRARGLEDRAPFYYGWKEIR